MKKILVVSVLVMLTSTTIQSQARVGEIKGPFIWKSKIYPGTEREYWLYLPAQYDAAKPACVIVVEDGLGRANEWKLPTVLDSLIALNQIPVMIGIFIDHGKVPSAGSDNYPRFNRSFEYDALGDRHARFLIEEILPEVGSKYNLSKDPNDRSISGASSGAIAAFNVAWERPDQFRRVLSTIGTYVGLRGGDEFATLVRKEEPRPLRVFLEDGNQDLNIYAGDWWMANQNMLSALTWAGYEVNHQWGDGGHNGKHGSAILAEALKWLWKDYPAPVQIHKGTSRKLYPLIEGESWKELNTEKVNKIAVNEKGEVFFTGNHTIYRIGLGGDISIVAKTKGDIGGIAIQDGEKLYVSDLRQRKILLVDVDGTSKEVISNVLADYMTLSSKGIYFTETLKNRIGYYSFSKKQTQYVAVTDHPTGLAISAEQTFLTVGLADAIFGYSLKINEDGSLTEGQEYIHYHIPYGVAIPKVRGMTVDSENLLYTATGKGIQISDQLGRVNFIITSPASGMDDVKFGGTDFATLYVSCHGKLYSRKTTSKGILSSQAAVKPPKPGL
ncbi:SMP-30/gluconolactonase/LRE family protein [soil metagenome]